MSSDFLILPATPCKTPLIGKRIASQTAVIRAHSTCWYARRCVTPINPRPTTATLTLPFGIAVLEFMLLVQLIALRLRDLLGCADVFHSLISSLSFDH